MPSAVAYRPERRVAARPWCAALRPLLVAALSMPVAQAAEGLQAPADLPWPTWQARFNLGMNLAADGQATTLRHAALLGDYYLQRHGQTPQAAWRGGFRATSGLVVGGLGLSAAAGAWSTSLQTVADPGAEPAREVWPYIGFGYSGLAPRGGWGFSADLGIALRQPSEASGRAPLGWRGWESALWRFDPLPMLQLGLRYRF